MTSFISPAGVWSTRRFCFWNFSRWKKVFFETVFHISENPNQPEHGSRSYVNLWIAVHRYQRRVKLLSENGAQISWPPSNMVMVAEKPLS
jgi:hypothetical protein